MERSYPVYPIEIYAVKASDSVHAQLLQKELKKRISTTGTAPTKHQIFLEVDPHLQKDYSITPYPKKILLKAKNDQKMTWLLYQYVSYLSSTDPSIPSPDLPPPIADFSRYNAHQFAFRYLEPYLAPNLQHKNHRIFGTNYLERDWGIWGHNLADVLVPDPDKTIYARINGAGNEKQFCFSSPEVYRQLHEYVRTSGAEYFMIMPRDNKLVCQCPPCSALGNTATSATPAVSFLVDKIARVFPKKQFFTSSYHTTTAPPAKRLPSNTGVMISTIKFPIHPLLKGRDQFGKAVQEWSAKVNTVFVWDYISNFDDYLSPLPILYTLQKRLKFYRDLGIQGVFLNGSGYDFASSQRYKTYIISSLLINPSQNTEQLSQAYFAKHYPTSGAVIHQYFKELEADFLQSDRNLQIYGGMQQNVWTYLNPEKFYAFYDTLRGLPIEDDAEKDRLSQLFAGLHFTYLQLALLNGTQEKGWARKEGSQLHFNQELLVLLDQLEQESTAHNISVYNEQGARLQDYITLYRSFLKRGTIENLLLDTKIIRTGGITPYQNTFLNDGVFGFPTDQHIGWVQIPERFSIEFVAKEDYGEKALSAHFLVLENYGIYAPQRVEISINGDLQKTVIPEPMKGPGNSSYAVFKVPLSLRADDRISVEFIPQEKDGTNITAIDELILN